LTTRSGAGADGRVDGTRARLIEAAERLFAARGIESVSLREITRESGARNSIALQYHFTDRGGLVDAIIAKHLPAIEAGRHALLDQYEAVGQPDVRALTGALVRPLATKLNDPDGGPEYLMINADMANRPVPSGAAASRAAALDGASGRHDERGDSIARWRALLVPLLDPEAIRLHRRFTAIVHCSIELGRRARSGPHTDDRLFTSYLIDVVTAILLAPISEETRRLATERDEATQRRR
jgi:AcrR family transcriptional regulator